MNRGATCVKTRHLTEHDGHIAVDRNCCYGVDEIEEGATMRIGLIAGLVLSVLASSAQAGFDADGVYRCVLEKDESNIRKLTPGTEFIVATWLTDITLVWPFGASERADDCEDIGTQRTCKNADNLILAFDANTKKFYAKKRVFDIRGVEFSNSSMSGSCQPMGLRHSSD